MPIEGICFRMKSERFYTQCGYKKKAFAYRVPIGDHNYLQCIEDPTKRSSNTLQCITTAVLGKVFCDSDVTYADIVFGWVNKSPKFC